MVVSFVFFYFYWSIELSAQQHHTLLESEMCLISLATKSTICVVCMYAKSRVSCHHRPEATDTSFQFGGPTANVCVSGRQPVRLSPFKSCGSRVPTTAVCTAGDGNYHNVCLGHTLLNNLPSLLCYVSRLRGG